ncbi:uncharacterized protein B0P05DRAFT_470267 [Gilbertella persicaria]|uniref:uncharacterized protein n=1 Tax=Gilbertella persicaria TaxID=101096 RepID=UPI00221E5493|nr:uncharacterized protein B0P05DRAFT_470267 [Gilbertella persicaria]KAI8078949.1 hypothetical protein B0P05DRAFT_470267 [Gilbertella persicaria]
MRNTQEGHSIAMDNAPIHVHENIESTLGILRCVFSPTYCYEFDSIEQTWIFSKVKRHKFIKEKVISKHLFRILTSVIIE